MDRYTFGADTVSVVIAERLSKPENKQYSRWLSRYLKTYQAHMLQLWGAQLDVKLRKKLIAIIRNEAVSTISNSRLPEDLKSFSLNWVSARHKNVYITF